MKTRDKILEAAKKLFAKDGFEKISTKKIAEEAGCNEVTLFRTFGNKNNLLEEILHQFIEENKVEKLLFESLSGEVEKDIEKSMILYQNFLLQNEMIFKLQLKLPSEKDRFVGTMYFKNYLVDHFMEVFYLNKINLTPEVFVHNMLSSIIGAFLLRDLSNQKFTMYQDEYFFQEKINFFRKVARDNAF